MAEAAGSGPSRVVTSSMIGMTMPDIARWSPRVVVVLGQNPGPFTGPGTNTYIVGAGRRRILLDTGQGIAQYDDLLENALGEHCDGASIERIVLTHAHPDHIGGVDAVRARHGDLPVFKMPLPASDRGIEVTALADGDVVRTEGATLEAVWTPGHARDHLCFLLREEGILFSGDNVLGAGTTVIPPDGDLGDYLDSLRRLQGLGAQRIFPAHGPAIDDPAAKIGEYLAHRALRDEQVLAGLRDGLVRTEDLVRRIYADVPEFLHRAAGVSVEAHLRRFAARGIVRRDGDRWLLAG
ncbi:MAG TPA: MBL fold metallo-hydrolase [Candidatus Binatia bacterium]|jgi:glyoxylase-like metal-dependent hydrolase (beta-lactamase superfamily II)